MQGQPKQLWWGAAIEAPDPTLLAAFYSKLLNWPVVHEDPGQTVLKPPQNSVYLVFQLANDYVPPVWPAAPGDQRTMMHLDFEVEDLEVAVADAVALGGRVVDFQPQENVRVMLDPAGHPFCLCRDDDS